ncbi:MAG: glycosyltransferase family 4 protein [Thermoleophilaceae bacterium]|nr:glycosyltransferase family 4 protein [Thermoleophilaceae bacterium]
MPGPRVLVVHNRYRVEGGEERSVELQVRALAAAGVEHGLFERSSSGVGRARAATALLRGGADPAGLAAAAGALHADVVHVHNMLPSIGPRGLAAARDTGARVVLHLHNLRLFCAIGVASRDGGPCFRCRGRLTLPGLALNCRGSLPESAAYATALALHQPAVLDAVDRFVAPSHWAAGQLARHGLPADRIDVLPHYLPAEAFASSSRAGGGYALVASRLSVEKGIDTAVRASAASGVPLVIAGEGPEEGALRELAASLGAPAELVGRADRARMSELLAGAGALVMPSRYHEFAPYSALEAMAAGLPVVASRLGGLPELIEPRRCVPTGDAEALARRLRALWDDPELRRSEGEALRARAAERHSERAYVARLLAIYADAGAAERPQ